MLPIWPLQTPESVIPERGKQTLDYKAGSASKYGVIACKVVYLSAPWFLNYNIEELYTSLFWGHHLCGEIFTENTESLPIGNPLSINRRE